MSLPARHRHASVFQRELGCALALAMVLASGSARGQEFPLSGDPARGKPRSKATADEDVFALRGPALYRPPPPAPERGSASWLGWGLPLLAGVAAVTTLGAVFYREVHAQRWNDARCLAPGSSRADVCGAELAAARRGERVALIGGGLTGFLTLGIVLHASASPDAQAAPARPRSSGEVASGFFGVVYAGAF